jgi:hypothetical protein
VAAADGGIVFSAPGSVFFSFFVAVRAVRTVRGGTCGILLALLVLSTVVELVVRFDFFHKLFF